MMSQYWRNEDATHDAIFNGWFKTGDVAVTKDGKWWIVDREKELIKVNELQVAPAELEAVFLEHQNVLDAAVVGITIDGAELPRAYIVLQDNAKGKTTGKDIQDSVAGKVARHKRLTGGVAFVDEIPKLASGKIVRKVLWEWARNDTELVGSISKARI